MPPKRTFMVEAYAPTESELAELLEQARRASMPDGLASSVQHIRSFLVPEDETCFHLYKAVSREALSTAVAGADIHANRIVEVVTR